jgi:hypothetical protein
MKMRPRMRWILLLWLSACDTSSSTLSDFGVVLPGCRAPSACWRDNCECLFEHVNNLVADDPLGCMVCDPARSLNGACDCAPDGGLEGRCQERAQVCVGAAQVTCDGLCVRKTSMLGCMDPNAEPPNEVASMVNADGGPGVERRCPYADDLCCN